VKTAFIYSDEYETFTYSPTHPLKPIRYKLTYELANAYGLFQLPSTRLIHPQPCTEEDLATVHSVDYIEAVKHGADRIPEWDLISFGLGTDDNPMSSLVYNKSLLAVGASLQAAKLVESGEFDLAFNIAGGQHHAFRNRASGFCYFNDVAMVIWHLLNQGYRVAYIDIDAHHSDGVQEIFYRTDQVLTISIHESGEYLFPWSGFERETGLGDGKGYTINVPLLPYSDDNVFRQAFHEIVPALLECFQPDVLVTQLGVDAFQTDPLTTLSVTTNGFCRVLEELKQLSPGKWVALGGGGYDVLHVPRAWTLAWGIMNDVELPDRLPEQYYTLIQSTMNHNGTRNLRDAPLPVNSTTQQRNLAALQRTLQYIREHQLATLSNC
jgi:acetoin utilization protein AcuC